MSLKRRSYEAGHKPKFLVVIDDIAGMRPRALFREPARARIGASVIMLLVIETARPQSAMARRRRHHEGGGARGGERDPRPSSRRARTALPASRRERVIREGETAKEMLKLIDEDEDIAILVLAAGTGKEGPGPLVTSLGKTAGNYPIPVAIVPGHLSDEDLDACRRGCEAWCRGTQARFGRGLG